MASLAEIRARLAAQNNFSKPQQSTSSGDKTTYPHWKMDEGKTAVIRFLPDATTDDYTNREGYFWVERQMIKLPFNGVLGQPDMKRVVVQVPCVEMYGSDYKDACPVHQELRGWYKDESLKEMANRYWKKRSYVFQGFVRQNPMTDDVSPENPIRRFLISPQIFTIIKSSLLDPELENLPTDYMYGLDFYVKKTSKGGYADYSTSNWARRESALTDEEQAAIEKHGLFKLGDFMPKKPGDAELRIIKEMFEASIDNQAYDPSRWGSYYKPWGLQVDGSEGGEQPSASTSSRSTDDDMGYDEEPAPVVQKVVVPKPAESITPEKATDILAMIKNRKPV